MADSPDIGVRTTGLRDFAGDSNVDIDADSIISQAAGAGHGSSQMDEGSAFFTANLQALTSMGEHLKTVQQGHYGLRQGANRIADTFTSTEDAVVAAQSSVTPYTPGHG